ncbi:MAG TPA: glycosyltransferase family 4 protein, partial [Vicinamibacterales bacterium]|nr:glycosyltransferase family 4 protein [Vicinamibacterales bacterium]
HRQPTAYASLGLMRRVPSIVDIDCTQACVRNSMTGALSRATLVPGVRRDGEVFDAASLIIASSAWAARSIADLYPGCRTPVAVIPPPVNMDAFDPAWLAERASRAARREKVRALFVGGDFDRKGGFRLLRAWRRGSFAERAYLDLVTDWPLAEARLPSGVSLHRGVTAYSERWRELWRAADLFVLPTRYEAYGMVFQEAAAAGLPRVGTRENAIPELIHHGDDGLLVEPGDDASLIAALAALVGDAELRARMGHASRTFIAASAAIDTYVPAFESAVRRAITEYHGRRAA